MEALSTEAATGGVLQQKVVLKNFTNFTGKHLCWSIFLIEFQQFRPASVLKKAPTQAFSCLKSLRTFTLKNICKQIPCRYRCFSVNFAKVVRTLLYNICEICKNPMKSFF